jgi:hypothetical protein
MKTAHHDRTLEEIRVTLEDLASEFASECLVATRAYRADEAALLRAVVASIEVARERVLDVSIDIAKYLTYCLDHDERARDEV